MISRGNRLPHGENSIKILNIWLGHIGRSCFQNPWQTCNNKKQESASKQNRRPPNRCPIFISFRLEPFRDWSPLRLDECWPYKASQKTSRPKLRYPVETINKAELCQLCSLLGFNSPQSKVHYIVKLDDFQVLQKGLRKKTLKTPPSS